MTPLILVRMVSLLLQPLLLFMFRFVMPCHVDKFDLLKVVIFGLIQIWECALNWFTVKSVHEPKVDICHLCGLGATYLKHIFC